ncbi:MAG: NUDIX hydrolase [Candidatus Woesebacteria bacterium GW2011_GWB1_39_12]|uniref:NUDIX hydrolase n=2 Tax=Candidatus Woeseibacteriota TaxID=1752722 RepID=A0A0G0PIG8_9BACT|nr:MAG: NUDIX hydrolase [Candidatus Woesebacteria bacterium GW2011_GWB1_39_12]KKQ97909.1 MAG: NUDIX hydrolase [Candidatus Woesebacteria bacterium GW2011_GWA1_39_12]
MAHTSEKLDYTVSAFIVFKNTVLLIYNEQYKAWFPPGGHIEKDEDLEDALYREINEETGLKKGDLNLIDIRDSIPDENIFSDMDGRSIVTPTFTDAHKTSSTHTHIAFRFFFTIKNKQKLTSEDEYVTKHNWFSLKDLENPKYNLRDHVKYYASFALNLTKTKT